MSAENRQTQPVEMPVIWLACTSCQLVYQPDQSAFESGATGCPRCGGWTWIAQLGSPDPTRLEKGHAAGCGRRAAGLATYDGGTSHDRC